MILVIAVPYAFQPHSIFYFYYRIIAAQAYTVVITLQEFFLESKAQAHTCFSTYYLCRGVSAFIAEDSAGWQGRIRIEFAVLQGEHMAKATVILFMKLQLG